MEDSTGKFLALMFRAKNIDRWGLMRCMFRESLSEHCYETAILTHALCAIGNTKLGKSYDTQKLVIAALYHDMSEILTGDLPTPVKYYNDDIKTAYKHIESIAENKLWSLILDEYKNSFSMIGDISDDEKVIIKAADKLSAYIKCLDELSVGNKEFESAKNTILAQMNESKSVELKYFIDNYLDSFMKTLDDITL